MPEQTGEDTKPEKQAEIRNPDGTFPKGVSGNPNGRPKGKTLKEFAREYLMNLPDEKKKEYLAQLPPEIVWKMAEGNPHTTNEVENKGDVTHTMLVKFLTNGENSGNTN